MGGVKDGVAVFDTDGMVEIGRSDRVNGHRVFDRAGKLVHKEEE